VIYVVLGMHKSGTTLLAQILHESGVEMVDAAGGGRDGGDAIDLSYDTGIKYERQSVLHLNLEILKAPDYTVLDVVAPDPLVATPAQLERMREIVRTCQKRGGDWGFKDPRTSLTYPLWADVLPEHRLVAIYRDPSEIWPRYRFQRWFYCVDNLGRARRFLQRWLEYNEAVLAALAANPGRSLLLDYRALMTTGEEYERLAAFLDRPLIDARRADLFRNRPRGYLHLTLANRWLRRRFGRDTGDVMARLVAARRAMMPGG
jgi:hypothetical protein